MLLDTLTNETKIAPMGDMKKARPEVRLYQRTILGPVQCVGVGLHSGIETRISLRPAGANEGIVFRRTDVQGSADVTDVQAVWQNVIDSSLCTTIQNAAGTRISTIEHLMAAIAGLEIDNLLIEIDGPEVPIMDGSAAPFIFLLECAGVAESETPRAYIEVLKQVGVSEQNGTGPKVATFLPGNRKFEIDCQIDFTSTAISKQRYEMTLNPMSFKNDIARARTFGFLKEVDQLRAAGLALGGSLENSVVIDGDTVMNEGGLRYINEFVRHKALDCVGDLYLAGYPIWGKVETYRSGHALNNKLLRALFDDVSAWRLVKPALETEAVEQDNDPANPSILSA